MKLGRPAIALVLVVGSLALACGGSPSQVSVNVDVTGDRPFQGVTLAITANDGFLKTFPDAEFGPTVVFRVGLFLPADLAGTVRFRADATSGSCLVGQGDTVVADLASGQTVPIALVVRDVPGCPAADGGVDAPSGTGGAGTPGSGGAGVPGSGGARGGTGGAPGGTGGAPVGTGGAGTGGAPVGTGGAGTGGAGTGGAPVGTGGAGPPGGLLLHYAFDEAAGTVAADSSGNGRDGTLVGGVTRLLSGRLGGAVSLGGTDGYVSLPSGVLDGAGAVTIATWVNVRTKQSWQRIFDFNSSASVNMFLTPNAEAAGNILRFAITLSGNPGEQRLESTAPPLGAWQHVTVVLGPGGGSLYVNGTLAATNAALTLRPADLRPIANGWLGRSAYTVDAYLTGDLDDFRIYSIALSAEEVRSVYGLASR